MKETLIKETPLDRVNPIEELLNNNNWKIIDRRYHEDRGVIASFDRRITKKYRLEYRYFTVDKWVKKIVDEEKKLVLDFGCGTGTATLLSYWRHRLGLNRV